jgi:DNA-binding winged helix-turn-helix (wHTH) protein
MSQLGITYLRNGPTEGFGKPIESARGNRAFGQITSRRRDREARAAQLAIPASPCRHSETKAATHSLRQAAAGYVFDGFRLLPTQRLLLKNDAPLPLGGRALDLLIALVERAGEVISKRELTAAIWPDTFVVEGNLKVHVSALRRALGEGEAGRRYISTVAGRGYCFVAPVAVSTRRGSLTSQWGRAAPAHFPTLFRH